MHLMYQPYCSMKCVELRKISPLRKYSHFTAQSLIELAKIITNSGGISASDARWPSSSCRSVNSSQQLLRFNEPVYLHFWSQIPLLRRTDHCFVNRRTLQYTACTMIEVHRSALTEKKAEIKSTTKQVGLKYDSDIKASSARRPSVSPHMRICPSAVLCGSEKGANVIFTTALTFLGQF